MADETAQTSSQTLSAPDAPTSEGAPAKQEAASAKAAPAARRGTGQKATGKMRAFRGNSFDDYFEHGMREFPWPARAFMGISCVASWLWTQLRWRWTIEDDQKLVGQSKPRVIVANHSSMLDPVIVVVHLWLHGQRVRAVYKDEFNHVKFLTWAISRWGGIPVVRGTADMKSMRRVKSALERGESVLVFPQGTRVKDSEEWAQTPVHGGYALMASLGKAEVQPMAIVGAADITPRGTHVHHFRRVWCKAGDPITFAELGVKGRKAQVAAMEDAAWKSVERLCDELRQEHPGKW